MKVFDNIMSWTKEEALETAKMLNIKGRSKMNKNSIAKALTDILLTEEYFKTVLLSLNKEQIEIVANCCKNGSINGLDAFKIGILLNLGYISFEEEKFSLCEEVGELFSLCYTEEFKSGLETRSKIITYCNVFSELYGIIPLDKAFEIYDKQNHDISETDFMKLMNTIGNKMANWEIYDNAVVDSYIMMEDVYDELKDVQSNKPYYIPSKKKIMKMAEPGYIEETNAYIALKQYMIKQLGVNEVIAENASCEIEMKCKLVDADIPDILCVFGQYGIELNDRNAKQIIKLVEAVDINTRKPIHRGFTDIEIEEMCDDIMSQLENDIFPLLF